LWYSIKTIKIVYCGQRNLVVFKWDFPCLIKCLLVLKSMWILIDSFVEWILWDFLVENTHSTISHKTMRFWDFHNFSGRLVTFIVWSSSKKNIYCLIPLSYTLLVIIHNPSLILFLCLQHILTLHIVVSFYFYFYGSCCSCSSKINIVLVHVTYLLSLYCCFSCVHVPVTKFFCSCSRFLGIFQAIFFF